MAERRKRKIFFDAGFYLRVSKKDLERVRELALAAGKKVTDYVRDCAFTARNHRIVANRDSDGERVESGSLSVSLSVPESPAAEKQNVPFDELAQNETDPDSSSQTLTRSLLIAEKTGHRPRCRCEVCAHLRSLCTRSGK